MFCDTCIVFVHDILIELCGSVISLESLILLLFLFFSQETRIDSETPPIPFNQFWNSEHRRARPNYTLYSFHFSSSSSSSSSYLPLKPRGHGRWFVGSAYCPQYFSYHNLIKPPVRVIKKYKVGSLSTPWSLHPYSIWRKMAAERIDNLFGINNKSSWIQYIIQNQTCSVAYVLHMINI